MPNKKKITANNQSPFNRTVQHDAKRTAILSEAARLFNARGSRATTLKDVAECLGLTKTSLYYYVKTKEDLIYQCYMAALAHHQATLDDIEKNYSRGSERASAALVAFFDNWIAANEGRAPHIAALLEIASLKQPRRAEVEAQYVAVFKRLRQYLRDGIAEGDLRDIHTTSATRALIGSLDWLFFWLPRLPEGEVHQAARQAQTIFSYGLNAGDAPYVPSELQQVEELIPSMPGGFNREEQNRQKQEAFFKAGTRFFNRKGFNSTSLDEIAEYLHVSKGAFYYHIKNKEDLLVNCYVGSMDLSEAVYNSVSSYASNGLEKIDHACRQIFHIQNSELGPLIRYNTITAIPAARRKLILKRTEAINGKFSDFVEEGIKDGSIRDVNTFVAQNLISGAVNASMDINLWRELNDPDEAAIDYFDIFMNGLIARN